MTEEKQEQQAEPLTEGIVIGDVKLSSAMMRVDELVGLALGILENKNAREYLDLVKNDKKLRGSMIG